jgi:hypothetical protein
MERVEPHIHVVVCHDGRDAAPQAREPGLQPFGPSLFDHKAGPSKAYAIVLYLAERADEIVEFAHAGFNAR